MFIGGPLLTGAASALAIALVLVVILMVRIGGEEQLLARELDGYDEYRRHVRWRLVPFVW
jgi:protein-S-isoprenylcysteine O-methyltransferase Ste14